MSKDKELSLANLENVQTKITTAEQYKEAGNAYYKNGNYKKAAGQYHRSVLYMKGIDNDLFGTPDFLKSVSVHPSEKKTKIPEEVEKRCIAINISIYNNLAASLLKIEGSEPSKIIHYTDIVLELDPGNSKALFRKAQAEYQSKDYESAAKSLKRIPTPDRSVKDLIQKVNSAQKNELQALKNSYKNMFK
uniref:Tetratricopeptide repeat protein 9C n=1 Tax=Caligus clemensi TaxID=344056 RepID=C1C128_CALCM|nr:Tetratricopeptide repeat protein 9C [Caligus clemensi]